ncbi:MAG: M1 family metallopeptidase [Bacteroidota bacterium]
MKRLLWVLLLLLPAMVFAKDNYWQQRVEYEMEIEIDGKNHQYTGAQYLTYYNNSPDTLFKAYFHLYFNAFQPGSMMDVRSRTIEDPDPRVDDRISKLLPSEIGYLTALELTQNGTAVEFKESGTILEVNLAKPILPGKKTKFFMRFKGQVPKQIRRSGRDNKEGIAYSMSQWYPKISEYDHMGWHPDPYIGREFHGVWGDFDVKITIDSAYTIGATGVLENPQAIGHGYENPEKKLKLPEGDKLTWHFTAEDVHDFVWAADKDYTHDVQILPSGTVVHYFFKNDDDLRKNWGKLPEYVAKMFSYANQNFGEYPYPQYSIIQGGDGGMEYAMATLITGKRKFSSLVGVTVHELVHSWYQMLLATNEGLYPWMDEGFTSYASSKIMTYLFNPDEDDRRGRYFDSYVALANSGKEEPMSKMADHYNTNYAYGAASYSKGAVFIAQLGYVMGQENLEKGIHRYFDEWSYKHPKPDDFIRVMEKVSGMELKWYLSYMLNTTEVIDYSIDSLEEVQGKTEVMLSRKGNFPMPVDLNITYTDGSTELVSIPLRMMRGSKPNPGDINFTVAEDWPWTNPTYALTLDRSKGQIERIEIDSSRRMADVNPENNVLNLSEVQDSNTQ